MTFKRIKIKIIELDIARDAYLLHALYMEDMYE